MRLLVLKVAPVETNIGLVEVIEPLPLIVAEFEMRNTLPVGTDILPDHWAVPVSTIVSPDFTR